MSVDARRLLAAPRRALAGLARRRPVGSDRSGPHEVLDLRSLLPGDLVRVLDARPGYVPASYRGNVVVARLQADVTVWQLAARTASVVADTLAAAGVQFFGMHRPYARVARWGVRRDELARVVDALRGSLGERAYYGVPSPGGVPRPLLTGFSPEELAELTDLTVFEYVRCTTTGKLHGAPEGCRIAVWDAHGSRDTLVAPDRASSVQEIDRTDPLPRAYRTRWDGETEPVLPGADRDVSAITFPVDAVYLWVDDSDPRWRARRDAVRERFTAAPPPPDGSSAAHLFRDRGELRASLRSLEMYAPWIRHIYLVTDDQRPDWLDTEHPRITVVDHREIFADPGALPSFNSHAIGSQVHRIPGLSDAYLLLNDDVMFARPVSPYDFFTPTGQLRIAFSRSRRPEISREHQSILECARTNSAELLEQDFGRRPSALFAHVPVPQRRDVATEVAERYAREIATTVRNPFRDASDVVVNSWLHLYTALLTGRAVPSAIRYGYFNVGRAGVRARMDDHAYSRRLQVICLNDVPPPEGEEEADPEWLSAWLARRFPVPAPYESSGTPRPAGGGVRRSAVAAPRGTRRVG